MSDIRTRHLRLISTNNRTEEKRKDIPPKRFAPEAVQLSLPLNEPVSLYLIHISASVSTDFHKLNELVSFRWLFDLRFSPRFDNAFGSRRAGFEYFSENEIRYHEVVGTLRMRNSAVDHSDFVSIGHFIAHTVSHSLQLIGPFGVFFDDERYMRVSVRYIQEIFSDLFRGSVEPRIIYFS
jgi:hypothetical protein